MLTGLRVRSTCANHATSILPGLLQYGRVENGIDREVTPAARDRARADRYRSSRQLDSDQPTEYAVGAKKIGRNTECGP